MDQPKGPSHARESDGDLSADTGVGTPGGVTEPLPTATPGDPLLSPAEVAALFRVSPKTVTR